MKTYGGYLSARSSYESVLAACGSDEIVWPGLYDHRYVLLSAFKEWGRARAVFEVPMLRRSGVPTGAQIDELERETGLTAGVDLAICPTFGFT